MRWWPRYEVLADAKRASKSKNPRLKWEYQCVKCSGWFPQKLVEVNHKTPCGTLKSFADLPTFVERLFCEKDGLEVTCKPCHLKETNKDKQ